MTTEKKKTTTKVVSVHYMRGIACIFVVLMHYGSFINNTFFFGIFGVDLFFIISGFIITLTTIENDSATGFMGKRFWRIYPCFFIVWAISVPALYYNEPIAQIIKSLFLIHKEYNWHSAPGYGWNLIGPPWTLTYEFLFYAIMWLAMLISHKHRVVIASLFIVVSVFSLQLIFNNKLSFDSYVSAKITSDNFLQIPVKLLSTTILFEFIFGMLVAYFYKKLSKLRVNTSIVLSAVFISLSIYLFITKPNVGFGFKGFFWHSSLLFTGILLLESILIKKMNSIFLFLGDISFTLYLVHFPLMKILLTYIPTLAEKEHKIFAFICIIIASFLASWLLHKYVELPIMKRKHRSINKTAA
ncbi:acyltransferase [Cronobacter dublinensis]|nr:acyltransferase [Cronobacter dublinensis]